MAGGQIVDNFHNFYMTDAESAGRYNAEARRLIDAGSKVLTGYESLAIGGLEGYITMFARSAGITSSRGG